ncbi:MULTISPECIES: SPFH domain-containing protein [unclassified Roseofilum]|uniref:SPFH domain-containing protein n=1 Tax=unclassified Roseofilum TaxID=2620099 RepID=UPI000E91009A|nr:MULTISPECIES: SPFH domain-containing protein [unclassified Roseofilum]HBQ99890.1 paraslipin [Cyanobacteria bacterium UBA11691]MBP0007039.1 SPFH/Band 7/PHB domain protein [Roseofilum sp. Belize Diploria]MBP0013331.1 SPFH/Band 7/PHB domain protein [Roseofilum sp. SID3]MBP0023980.1 SPFH/Band 7/PHB domain protein [Roseofilum sp. SID2]MBP0031547.1 SPFH/Band 7/PHB domain protein [Roseofilum sp. Belize BBD 4]
MIPSIIIFFLVAIACLSGSLVIIPEPYQGLVERLGKYHRTLGPGVNFIIPLLEKVVIRALMSERLLDVPPQQTITKDNVSLAVDAIVYWQIVNLRRAYYAINDIEHALENLVLTNLRGEIGRLEMSQTFSGIKEINQSLLEQIDSITDSWGVKLIRVEVRDITPPKTILESLEKERAAESQRLASIIEAQGGAQSMKILAEALGMDSGSPEFIQFIIARHYLDTNEKLTASPNSKVFFMNPSVLNETLINLLESERSGLKKIDLPPTSSPGNGSEGNPDG